MFGPKNPSKKKVLLYQNEGQTWHVFFGWRELVRKCCIVPYKLTGLRCLHGKNLCLFRFLWVFVGTFQSEPAKTWGKKANHRGFCSARSCLTSTQDLTINFKIFVTKCTAAKVRGSFVAWGWFVGM